MQKLNANDIVKDLQRMGEQLAITHGQAVQFEHDTPVTTAPLMRHDEQVGSRAHESCFSTASVVVPAFILSSCCLVVTVGISAIPRR